MFLYLPIFDEYLLVCKEVQGSTAISSSWRLHWDSVIADILERPRTALETGIQGHSDT